MLGWSWTSASYPTTAEIVKTLVRKTLPRDSLKTLDNLNSKAPGPVKRSKRCSLWARWTTINVRSRLQRATFQTVSPGNSVNKEGKDPKVPLNN